MASTPGEQSKIYDNNGQYTRVGILRYERLFGEGHISTGGPETTERLCKKLGDALRPGVKVLDVGCGIGGAALELAKRCDAEVTGIDLAPLMVQIANERAGAAFPKIKFHVGDIFEQSFAEPFDIIWSRDALLHIDRKGELFGLMYKWLKPGGHVAITDYCRRPDEAGAGFEEYVRTTGYALTDPENYGRLLKEAGFSKVEVEDATEDFMKILLRESKWMDENKDDFINEFSAADWQYLQDRWEKKREFIRAGDMKWGVFHAVK